LDSLDKAILLELSENCRMSYALLSRKYNVSSTTIKNRVSSLIERRIILGYIIRPRLELFGASTALVQFTVQEGPQEESLLVMGNHDLVQSLGIGLSRQGFAATVFRTSEDLNKIAELFYSEEIEDFEIYQVLSPPSTWTTKPTKGLEGIRSLDWRIIYHLQNTGRRPLKELSKLVGASVPTLRKRLDYLRHDNLIESTILLNPGAIQGGLMVVFLFEVPMLTMSRQSTIERQVIEELGSNFWVSWKVVDRPLLLLVFHATSNREILSMAAKIAQIIPDGTRITETTVGEMHFFPDFRSEFIKKMSRIH
jgi:DNA-binding Lrp family transcriptional regulator